MKLNLPELKDPCKGCPLYHPQCQPTCDVVICGLKIAYNARLDERARVLRAVAKDLRERAKGRPTFDDNYEADLLNEIADEYEKGEE